MRKKHLGDWILVLVLIAISLLLFTLFVWNKGDGSGIVDFNNTASLQKKGGGQEYSSKGSVLSQNNHYNTCFLFV